MYKELLRSMEGVEIGGTIGFMIFFCFFIALLVYVWKMKKEYIDEMKQLPLDQE